jgi:hypothetical protein
MNRRAFAGVSVLFLIAVLPLSADSDAVATLRIDPAVSMTSVRSTFSVNLTIADVTDLAGWEFKLYYLSTILNGTEIMEGPFLKQSGSTFFEIINFTDDYNSTHGLAWVTSALLGTARGVDGTGVLATVTFKSKELGNSALTLADTSLTDSQPIPHTATGGTVYVLPHDVAVTDLKQPKTIVGQGSRVQTEVTIANRGNFTETPGVTFYANETITGTCSNITLKSEESETFSSIWDSASFPYGNYTLSAVASPVPDENDTSNNVYVLNTSVHVGVLGDVTSAVLGVYDGRVDTRDVTYVILLFQTDADRPNWNPNADIDDNGVVDTRDITTTVLHFFQHE